MKISRLTGFGSRLAAAACLALLCLSQAPRAHADTMVMSDINAVWGHESTTFSFDAPSAGTVTAKLWDIGWTSPLSTLTFSATTASSVLSSWSAATQETQSFQVGPGTYFAHILATAGGPLDAGAYALSLSFSPSVVPLPASDWMLVTGVLVLFGLTRILSAFGWFEGFRATGAVVEG
jgi:hypothetical protein